MKYIALIILCSSFVFGAVSLNDTFTRTNESGWGMADSGQPWVLLSTINASVNGSNGVYNGVNGNNFKLSYAVAQQATLKYLFNWQIADIRESCSFIIQNSENKKIAHIFIGTNDVKNLYYYRGSAGGQVLVNLANQSQWYNSNTTYQFYGVINDTARSWSLNITSDVYNVEVKDIAWPENNTITLQNIANIQYDCQQGGSGDNIVFALDDFILSDNVPLVPTQGSGISYIVTSDTDLIETDTFKSRIAINTTLETVAYLNFSGSLYAANKTINATHTLYNISVPTQLNPMNTTNAVPFTWVFNFSNENGTLYNFTTSPATCNFWPLKFYNCSAANTATTVMYSVYNELTNTLITQDIMNFTSSAYLYRKIVNNSRSTGYSAQNKNNFTLCIAPYNGSVAAYNALDVVFNDKQIITYTGEGYSFRTYIIDKVNFTNITQYYKLFAAPETDTVEVLINLKNQYDDPLPGYIVYIQRFRTDTNTYDTVQIGESDFNGQFYANLITTNVFYRFIVYKDGSLIYMTGNGIISGTEITIKLQGNINPVDPYNIQRSIISNIIYNNNTGLFTATITDPTNVIRTHCFYVDELSAIRSIRRCDTCTQGSSLIMSCTVNPNTTASFYAFTTVQLSPETTTGSLSVNNNKQWQQWGLYGAFLAFFLLGTLFLIGRQSPASAIFLTIFGVIIVFAIGLTPWTISFISVICLTGLLLLWRSEGGLA